MSLALDDPRLAPFLSRASLNKKATIAMATLCLAIASIGFFDHTASTGETLGLAIPFTLIAALILFVGFQPAHKHAAIATLRERPDDIVWLYIQKHTVNNQRALTSLVIALADGKTQLLGLRAADENPARQETLLAQAKALAPKACIGYSAELAQRYKRDPASVALSN